MTFTPAITRRAIYPSLFIALALTVLAVSRYDVLQAGARSGIGIAVAIDLTLFVPLLWHLLMVRGRDWPVPTVFAVMFAMTLAARLVHAGSWHPEPRFMSLIAVVAELALLASLVAGLRRAGHALSRIGASGRVERIRAAAAAAVGDNRSADVLGYEAAVLWHALFSWRQKPPVPASPADTFTVHAKSGYGGIVVALLLAIAAETVPMHLLISRLGGAGAWVITVLAVYGALWLIADLQASRFQPVELRDGRLRARTGLRWAIETGIERIRSVERLKPGQPREPGALRMALPGSKQVRIRFASPVEALGPYGARRTVEVVDLGLDEPDRFIARLEPQLDGRLIS